MEKRKYRLDAFEVTNILLMLFIMFITLYPFIYIFSVSLSSPIAVTQGKVVLFPVGFNPGAYVLIFKDPIIYRSMFNTILYTTVGTALNLCLTLITAYPLSKRKLYGKEIIMFFIVFTMFFSGGMIPTYLLVRDLHMINKIWAVVLPGAIIVWNLLMTRTFFQSIPDSLEESATIDGCNDIGILTRIYIPLSMPILVTIGLFYAVGHWNSFFGPFIYLNQKSKYPIQLILRQMVITGDMAMQTQVLQDGRDVSELIVPESIKYATIIVAVAPILLFYPYIQKFFVKGVMIGSIKG